MMTSQKLTSPDFDWQQLRQLAGDDRAFECELLEMFLQDAQQSLKDLDQAIANNSLQTIRDVAHALRGASANVGASALALVARQLEEDAQSNQIAAAPEQLQQIKAHCASIQAYLDQAQVGSKA